ncbi:hypothetical protein CE91St46_19320 [Eubacteriales bacterium]|nr:hypothetical protein [Faecalicatena sp. BF-R-105]GKH50821.1 hypothetical protein CE91St46_19320 [Eubacteriales bacterium]GKH63543.1 hypothetical protein CE91St47_20120 [Eubacteriales bacterium]
MEEQGKGLFQKLLRREGWRRAIVAIGIAGMVLILLGSLFPGSQGQSGTPTAEEGSMNSQEYLEKTEARLERLLSGVQGVGKVSVMLTLEHGVEYRYAKDEKLSQNSTTTYSGGTPQRLEEEQEQEQSYLLIDSSGGRRPLVLTELPPRIQGVVVVCEGAGSAPVASRVIDVVTTSLGITSLQVCVVQSANK